MNEQEKFIYEAATLLQQLSDDAVRTKHTLLNAKNGEYTLSPRSRQIIKCAYIPVLEDLLRCITRAYYAGDVPKMEQCIEELNKAIIEFADV
jgi:hypothetical protein